MTPAGGPWFDFSRWRVSSDTLIVVSANSFLPGRKYLHRGCGGVKGAEGLHFQVMGARVEQLALLAAAGTPRALGHPGPSAEAVRGCGLRVAGWRLCHSLLLIHRIGSGYILAIRELHCPLLYPDQP